LSHWLKNILEVLYGFGVSIQRLHTLAKDET